MRRRAALALPFALTLAAGGCATPPQLASLIEAAPADLPPRALLDGVAHFPSGDDLCGPAVLASLLSAAGRPATLPALTAEVYLPGRRGTLQAEMLAGARRRGLLAWSPAPTLADGLGEVAAGLPVAALVNLSLPAWPRWHYVVVVGYDLGAREVTLHSGEQAFVRWPLATFEHTWARSGHWAFVAPGPGRLPATADAARLLPALLALDRAAPRADAARAWDSARRRWPDDAGMALGSGNAWLASGDAARAEGVLAEAANRFDAAVAWNNLAMARLRLGDRRGALAAARRAVERAESVEPRWLEATRQTLREVAADAAGGR